MDKKYEINLPTNPAKSIIKVIGVGGGGSNAVNYMFNRGIKDVEFIVCNTDLQALNQSAVPAKIQIGTGLTEGLGAGANPDIGREAAVESREEIRELLSHGTKMLFITAGMGGGTGTGAAPMIAEIARELGVLTVAIVTAPFQFEGKRKRKYADAGIAALRDICDTVLVISNDKLLEIYGNLKMSEAFAQADNILTTAAKGIAEMITVPQDINVDFEDVKTVMRNSGAAVMGSAKAEGENRALRAAQEALTSPLLNNKNIFGAQKILLSVMSGEKAELQMDEFQKITSYIEDNVGEEADMIFGVGKDSSLGESVRVTIIATGFKDEQMLNSAFENKMTSIKTKPVTEEVPQTVVFNVNSKSTLNSVFEEKSVEKKEPEKIVFNLDDDLKDEADKYSLFSPKSAIDLKKEQLNKEAEERIAKLKNIGKNIESEESFKEKIEVPAYLRRNVKLMDNNASDTSNSPSNSNIESTSYNPFKLKDDNSILGNSKFFSDKD
jgi:cell division protein FtsZ